MAAQADVIGFDESGAAAAQEWLQLLQAQANRDPPKELFSFFHKTTTVLCPHRIMTAMKPWTMSTVTLGRSSESVLVVPPEQYGL